MGIDGEWKNIDTHKHAFINDNIYPRTTDKIMVHETNATSRRICMLLIYIKQIQSKRKNQYCWPCCIISLRLWSSTSYKFLIIPLPPSLSYHSYFFRVCAKFSKKLESSISSSVKSMASPPPPPCFPACLCCCTCC